jgi:hypothetical protein
LNGKVLSPYFTGVWGRYLLMKIKQTRRNLSNKTGDYDRIALRLLVKNAVSSFAQCGKQHIFGRNKDAKSKRNAAEVGGSQPGRY